MKKILFLISVCFIFIMIGCADKPNSIGNGLPTPYNTFSFAETTLTTTSDTTFLKPIITGYGASNLVGRMDNNEEVVSLFNFIPLVVLDSLNGASLDTVEFRLTVNYRLKADLIPTEFELYEVLQSWSEGTLTSDTLVTFGTTLLGTFSDSMSYGQEIKIGTVNNSLDTNAIRRWINSNSDTSEPRFYGFVLRPKAGTIPGIIGFNTFSSGYSYPTLVIKYTTPNGTFDSLTFTYGYDTYIAKYNSTPAIFPFEVRGGFAIRSKIMFDPSFLQNKQMINRATITLVVDTTQTTKGGYSPDSLIILLAGENDSVSSYLSSYNYAYGVLQKDELTGAQTYVFETAKLFQLWTNNIYYNYGLNLRWGTEASSNEKVVFYGSNNADNTKRPKVDITYSSR